MANITKEMVDGAVCEAGKAQTFFWDEKLHGFGLRVMGTGTKSFIIEYRPKGSAQSKRFTLGRYGKITAAEARKLAHGHFSQIAGGANPIEDDRASKAKEKAAKNEKTISEMIDAFVAGYVTTHCKPSTLAKERHSLNHYVKPYLGKLKVSALTNDRIIDWYESLTTKTAANRALAYFRVACRDAKLPSDLCRVPKKNKEIPKDRYFSDQEFCRIGPALNAFEALGELEASLAMGVRLLALTGLRKSEVQNLRWEDYDAQSETLTLRDSKTGGRKVGLFPETVSLLNNTKRVGAFIVTGANPAKPVSDTTMGRAVSRVLKLAKIEGASAHTFRHTVATYMAQHGDGVFQIMPIGGWKTVAMVQRYVNTEQVGKRNPLTAGQRISISLAGSNVIPMKAIA